MSEVKELQHLSHCHLYFGRADHSYLLNITVFVGKHEIINILLQK